MDFLFVVVVVLTLGVGRMFSSGALEENEVIVSYEQATDLEVCNNLMMEMESEPFLRIVKQLGLM